MKRCSTKGFTLIEFALVVGLLGMLLVITTSLSTKLLKYGKSRAAIKKLENIGKMVIRYENEKGAKPSSIQALVIANYLDKANNIFDMPYQIDENNDVYVTISTVLPKGSYQKTNAFTTLKTVGINEIVATSIRKFEETTEAMADKAWLENPEAGKFVISS